MQYHRSIDASIRILRNLTHKFYVIGQYPSNKLYTLDLVISERVHVLN